MANVCCVQVPSQAVELEDAIWLVPVPEIFVEDRYLHFREHEGRECSAADSVKKSGRTGTCCLNCLGILSLRTKSSRFGLTASTYGF